MSNIFSLFKIQFLCFLGINGNKKSKKAKATSLTVKIFMILLYVALIIYISIIYSEMYAEVLYQMGLIIKLIPLMIAMSCLLDFFFNFYVTSGILYNSKDYDMLASMPIKNSEIIISRLAFMYLISLAITTIVTVSSSIIGCSYGLTIDAGYIIRATLLVVFSPLIPICLAVVVGLIVSIISSFFIKKNIVQFIGYFVLFVAIFAFSFLSGMSYGEQSINIPLGVISKLYFVMPITERGIEDILYTFIFMGISTLSFVVVALFVSATYKRVNAILNAKRTRGVYKSKKYTSKSQFSALCKKEVSRIFAYPMYAVNTVTGPLLLVVLGVIIAVLLSNLKSQLIEIGVADLSPYIIYAPALFTFSCIISPSSVSSISIEGNTFWVVRTSPIRIESLFRAKIFISNIFSVIPSVAVSILLSIILGANIVQTILTVCLCTCIAMFGTNFGLFINILLPKMNWDNAQQVVKNSGATFITCFLGMILSVLIVVAGIFIKIESTIFLSIMLAFMILLTVAIYLTIIKEGDNLLRKRGY